MHVRQRVRNAFTLKIKAVPKLKDTTFESRVYQLSKEDLPAALVFTESETNESATAQKRPSIQKRRIETVVYLFTRADKELENELDSLSEQIEDALLIDQTLGGIAVETILDNTTLLIGGDPDAPTGASRMSFITTVLTQQGESGSPIQQSGGIF